LAGFKEKIMPTKGFFKDIRVVDFGWMGVGPFIIKYLLEYGAEVIKIESQGRPDPLRTMPPFKDNKPHQEGSFLFSYHHNSKYGLALNLKNPKGIEVAKRLVATADVVLESYSPGVMVKFGMGYDELKKVKPDLIMVSTAMQGQTGPNAASPGTGMTLVSLSGFTNITGWPDRVPSGVYGPYTDFIAPLFGASALHAALDYRKRTGKGQYLDLSQLEASLQFLAPLLLDYGVNKRVAERQGNYSTYAAPHGVYRCSGEDRWVAIAVCDDEQWKGFCRVIGEPEWTREDRFATFGSRLKNSADLDLNVGKWTAMKTAEEVMKLMQGERVPAGVVQNSQDLWNDPQMKHYSSFGEVEHPAIGRRPFVKRAVELPKMGWEMKPYPMIGEHTELVCKKMLGMTDEEFVELLGEGVFD
jgi:benzylsuccinate CoA-transferase BbsF subunit